jgi:thiol-disulfide isomerase/thioredoxin
MKAKILLAAVALGIAAATALALTSRSSAPEVRFATLSGEQFSTSDLRGKVVLVNFWATWCVPCREEMPSIERLRTSLAGRPFVVLAVNLAEPESRIRKFLEAVPVGFPVLLDQNAQTAKAWQARVLPATFLVGPDGVVRYQHFGELDWSKPEVRETILALLR